jgi:fructuronate reductase/mannitol 2-dehydrogenase
VTAGSLGTDILASVPLSRASLKSLPAGVAAPRYDPAQVRPGIVHLGLGGFHRAHMARYTHDLMEARPDALGWGIVGAGLRAEDRGLIEAMAAQDGLYTLVERDQHGEAATVVGSIRATLYAGETTGSVLGAIADPAIRIVSLTVTEHGYCLNAATKTLDLAHPMIAADLESPGRPHTAVGVIVEGLRRRMAAGLGGFTALSCDNIQHNGRVLEAAVLAYADALDPALARWIADKASFPSTMVDRITPAAAPGDGAYVAERFAIADRCPVLAEPFRQWVIEDRFSGGRPAWEDVGAQFVDDVEPYEFMKLRLLNASHLAIAGLGALIGYARIDEAMGDAGLRRYMAALMDRETGPTLRPVPGVDLAAYKATLIERFANPAIKDTVRRVNRDAALNYLLDPIRDRVAAGQPIDLLALALAAWLRRMRGVDEGGVAIPIDHPQAELLRRTALAGGTDPRPLLGLKPIFGDLGADPRVIGPVERALGLLAGQGGAAAVQIVLG